MVVAALALAALPVIVELVREQRREATFERLIAEGATPEQFRAALGESSTDVSGRLGRCISFQLGPSSLQSACWRDGRVVRGPGMWADPNLTGLIRASYRRFFHADPPTSGK